MQIKALKALEDNYIWLIEEGKQLCVVDPGEAEVVINYLEKSQLELQAILLTHCHQDHTGGVEKLTQAYPELDIYGPVETEELNTHTVAEADCVERMDQCFKVLKTPGHTEEHISYLAGSALFCGDALFSAGCGRVFTGDYEAEYKSLKRFAALDSQIQVYAGHEYTLTNLEFALEQGGDYDFIQAAIKDAQAKLKNNQPTLPSSIGFERRANLFMQAETVEEFKALRDRRDDF